MDCPNSFRNEFQLGMAMGMQEYAVHSHICKYAVENFIHK